MLLNFTVDLLLLLAANYLCGYSGQIKRILLAALLGGVYGGICVLPGLFWFRKVIFRMLCLMVMAGIAFGFHRYAVHRGVIFVFLTMALGGISVLVGQYSFWVIILCSLGVIFLCVFGLRRQIGVEYIPIKIAIECGDLRFFALRDTGNTLVDPVSGQKALVVSSEIGAKLFGLLPAEFQEPVSAVGKIPGSRLIPFHSVGKEGGLMLAKRCDNITIGKWSGSCLVAVSPNQLGMGEPYDALLGGVI
jgi:stage II sporulation protein GA (sporulation sigma-E factor processing peptidase)